LNLTNIRVSIQNYDDDERVVRKAYDSNGTLQDTIFLSSRGVYRLLYNSKKEIAKKFRKWAGSILDDIVFNESKQLKQQIDIYQKQLLDKETNHRLGKHNNFIASCDLRPVVYLGQFGNNLLKCINLFQHLICQDYGYKKEIGILGKAYQRMLLLWVSLVRVLSMLS